jgi:acetyl esterase
VNARCVLDAIARGLLADADGPPAWTLGVGPARQAANEYKRLIDGSEVVSARRTAISGAPVPMTELVPAGTEPWATVLYFHGGGWTVGSPELLEGSCLLFARAAGVRVVSIQYRLAPEHVFPAAVEDCIDACRWLLDRATDPVVLMGESAGGNLAAATTAWMTSRGQRAIAAQIVMNPALDPLMESETYTRVGDGFGLTRGEMAWFWSNYLSQEADRTDPRAAPIRAELAGLPPTYVLTSGFDPLCGEGIEYVERLRRSGVAVTHDHRCSLPHNVFWTTGAVPEARAAVLAAAGWLSEHRAELAARPT